MDVEELKDAAVNHQGETISMLGQMFDHVESRLLIVRTTYPLSTFSSSGDGGPRRSSSDEGFDGTSAIHERPEEVLHRPSRRRARCVIDASIEKPTTLLICV